MQLSLNMRQTPPPTAHPHRQKDKTGLLSLFKRIVLFSASASLMMTLMMTSLQTPVLNDITAVKAGNVVSVLF